MGANSAPETRPSYVQRQPLSDLSLFSGLEAVRDLFAFLKSDQDGWKNALAKLPDTGDRAALQRVIDLTGEIEGLLPQAERAALSGISEQQWQKLSGPKLQESLRVQNRSREAHSIDLDRVVIVPKISKIEYRMRREGLSFDEVVAKLSGEQDDVKIQVESHKELNKTRAELLRYFRPEQIIDRDQFSAESFKSASLVIALGGDDHLGFVTQKVSGDIPVLGMKADPMSVGAVLSCAASELGSVVKKIESAEYKFEPWLRMKISVDGKVLPPVLGIGFLGDKHTDYLSRNLIQIEAQDGTRLFGTEGRGIEQRSSGVLVYTGTGSTSWPKSAQRYLFPEGKPFPKDSRYIEFVLREPSDTVASAKGGHALPELLHAVIHEGERMIITSLNKDGGIVSLDSVFTVPFPRGSKAVIEIDPEPIWIIIPDAMGNSKPELKLANPKEGVCSRTSNPKEYPARFKIPSDKYSWDSDFAEYKPVFFEHEKLKTAPWAEAADVSREEFISRKLSGDLRTSCGELKLDPVSGRPLNPVGRTGIAGRGVLGKHGANFAVDPIVVYQDEETKTYHLLMIQRKSGAWALPGGMVDKGEDNLTATLRELEEETNVSPEKVINFRVSDWGETIYSDDPRSTDNAWIETTPGLFFLDKETALSLPIKAASDAIAVKWMEISDESLGSLYASHAYMINEAVKHLSS